MRLRVVLFIFAYNASIHISAQTDSILSNIAFNDSSLVLNISMASSDQSLLFAEDHYCYYSPILFDGDGNPCTQMNEYRGEDRISFIDANHISKSIDSLSRFLPYDSIVIRLYFVSNNCSNRFYFSIESPELSPNDYFNLGVKIEHISNNILRNKNLLFRDGISYTSWFHHSDVPSKLLLELPREIFGINIWDLKWARESNFKLNLGVFSNLAPVVTVVLDIDLPYKNGKVTSLYHISESFVIENKAL